MFTRALILAGLLSSTAYAQCPPLPGLDAVPDLAVTAQQVEDGTASLKDFALSVRDQQLQLNELSQHVEQFEAIGLFGCQIRQENSAYFSGSTYIVTLTLSGRVFAHAKDMDLSGWLIKPEIFGSILSALGVSRVDMINMASPDHDVSEQAFHNVLATLSQRPDGAFDATRAVPGASGYVVVFPSVVFDGNPMILLVGFDLDRSHVVEEDLDYGNPTVTAADVTDRATLKAFVMAARDYIYGRIGTGNQGLLSRTRIALRDPEGPWRHGSVYLYVLDRDNQIILLHGAFPTRFELRPLVPTVRDAITGELVLPQVIEAAKSGPEGGFIQYFFDDPTDDTDSADVPKVGYAVEFSVDSHGPDGEPTLATFIIGSGFYGNVEQGVQDRMDIVAKVIGDNVADLDVEFARSVAGRPVEYEWSAVTDAAGALFLSLTGQSGYYSARAKTADGSVVGQWNSIPLNLKHRQFLDLPIGGVARVTKTERINPTSLSQNTPNPFNSTTSISYYVADSGPVRLEIYNVLGQKIQTLVDKTQAAGYYRVRWAVSEGLATGVYIARLTYPGGVQTRRLLFLK